MEQGKAHDFSSTNEVYIMARCNKSIPSSACTDFEIEYQLVTIAAEAENNTDWSMIITIYIGFSIMFIAFLYFEWRSLFMCCKRC